MAHSLHRNSTMHDEHQDRRRSDLNRRSFIGSTAAACSAFLLPDQLNAQPTGSSGQINENQCLRLRNGRVLGFATYGVPSAWPVLYFHGIPTSRIEARHYAAAAIRNGCQLIAIDRPGIGVSTFQCGRSIVHWLDDVLEFIDSPALPVNLHLDQFSIATFSSGAAYTLLCAARLPQDRVRSVAVVSGIAPLEQLRRYGGQAQKFFRLAARRPNLARAAFNFSTRRINRRPDRMLRLASRFFSRADARIFNDPRTNRVLIDSYGQCVRQGPAGVIHDMSILSRPWGFSLGEVTRRVSLWYGACDITTPANSMGECLNRLLPNSHLNIFSGDGHLSMYDSVNDQIFGQLVADIG